MVEKKHLVQANPFQGITFLRKEESQKDNQAFSASVAKWMGDESWPEKLQFPDTVPFTTLRPDIFIWSEEGKKIILVERTAPWEEGSKKAAER